ncbi:MAG: TIGR01777 family oxidoreductase [Planctomycetaceae bacterium]
MKIIIPGGTGQVGSILARDFLREGHEVVILSRKVQKAPFRVVRWDPAVESPPPDSEWVREFDGADAVINLAGKSVNCRYHAKNRREIMQSRIDSVRAVASALANVARPPRVWLQASTATIYAHRYDQPNDEFTGMLGGNEPNAPDTWRFSIDVAKAWEQTFDEAVVPGVRKVKLRAAMIMSPDRGGTFDILLGLLRKGLGGTCGDGRQFMSWIHDTDFVHAIKWLISREEYQGAVNICSPHPLPQREFMSAMRQAWGIRIGLPATKWMLEVGAVFMKTETELILKSRRVIPGRLLQDGFQFHYPDWPAAADELCHRWRRGF